MTSDFEASLPHSLGLGMFVHCDDTLPLRWRNEVIHRMKLGAPIVVGLHASRGRAQRVARRSAATRRAH